MRVAGVCLLWAALLSAGCGGASQPASLTLATTTSTRDSGLLDELLPHFERATGSSVKVIAVGSGQALELGRRGDADVLLSHALEAETAFMEEGHSSERQQVMHNDFVLVGPSDDPAEIKDVSDVATALRRIAASQSPFVSRGDESGTHQKERQLWRAADASHDGQWYIQAGAGMAAALRIAEERRAYTLSDRGTYLAQRKNLSLEILSQGDPVLRNVYSVIVIDAQRHPGVNEPLARKFAQFLLSSATQQTIAEFGAKTYGEPLFYPRTDPSAENASRARGDAKTGR